MSSGWSGYSEEVDDGLSNVVYYYEGPLSPSAIIIIVVIIIVVIVAFTLSVSCYCLNCRCPRSKQAAPWYSRIYQEAASSSEQLSEPKVVFHRPRDPRLLITNLIAPPLLRTQSDGVIPTAKLCEIVKLRRAVSEDEIVTIELPLRETLSVGIVPYTNSDTVQIEVARGRGAANTAASPALLNTDQVPEGRRSSPINEEVIIHHDRTVRSRGASPISTLSEVKNSNPGSRGVSPISLPPPLHTPDVDRKRAYRTRPNLSIRPVRHELDIRPASSFDEIVQHMETRYPTPDTLTNRPPLRKQRVLPQNDLIWSDELTEDEARTDKGQQKFAKPPKIVPEHLQGRDVQWTDPVLGHQNEDSTDVDVNELEWRASNHVIESSDDEYHSTHSDISVEDSPGCISENSGTSGPILSENSGKSDPILSTNFDKSGPVLSESSGSSAHNVTVPTKHLVL